MDKIYDAGTRPIQVHVANILNHMIENTTKLKVNGKKMSTSY